MAETPAPWRGIVGIVRDIKGSGLTEPTPMQVYMPFGRDPPRDFLLVVRSAGDTAGLATSIETAIHALDGDVPVYGIRRMTDIVGSSLARERVAGLVLAVFAVVALTLAAVGLYGLVAQGVIERRQRNRRAPRPLLYSNLGGMWSLEAPEGAPGASGQEIGRSPALAAGLPPIPVEHALPRVGPRVADALGATARPVVRLVWRAGCR